MVLRQAFGVERRVLNFLPIVQEGSVLGAFADLVSAAFDHGVFVLGDGLLSVCTIADLDQSISDLASICERMVQSLASLVGHWMGSVADQSDEAVVV